jgi:hypothetical protein
LYQYLYIRFRPFQKRSIQAALHHNRWRKVTTAPELEIDKNILRRKIQWLWIKNQSEPRLTVALKRFSTEFIAGSETGGKSTVN